MPSTLARIQAELDRVGVSYEKAGGHGMVYLEPLSGGRVVLKGAPTTGLAWRGLAEEALNRLAPLADDAGPDAFWTAFASDPRPRRAR